MSGEAGTTTENKVTEPTVEDLRAEVAKAQAERDEVKAMLGDPEYIKFLAGSNGQSTSKETNTTGTTATNQNTAGDALAGYTDEQLEAMSTRDIIRLAAKASGGGQASPEIVERLQALTDAVTMTQAQTAVERARSKYPDFDDYRAQMIQIVKQPAYAHLDAASLYHIAKGQSGVGSGVKTKEQAAAAARASSERPNAQTGATGKGEEPGTFDPKDEDAAAKAALASVKKKYGN